MQPTLDISIRPTAVQLITTTEIPILLPYSEIVENSGVTDFNCSTRRPGLIEVQFVKAVMQLKSYCKAGFSRENSHLAHV
jgi:hypothetical protein